MIPTGKKERNLEFHNSNTKTSDNTTGRTRKALLNKESSSVRFLSHSFLGFLGAQILKIDFFEFLLKKKKSGSGSFEYLLYYTSHDLLK